MIDKIQKLLKLEDWLVFQLNSANILKTFGFL